MFDEKIKELLIKCIDKDKGDDFVRKKYNFI